jgi:nucleotide-binding universal stress UspA family protein
MKPVLCALDFSESSRWVMRSAIEVALRHRTSLIVLFSYRLVQPFEGTIADYRKNVESKARASFEELIKKVSSHENVKYEFRSEIGFLSDRIEAYVEKNDVGVIVIGHEMANAMNDHKGMSLQQFINTIKVPILIVPEEALPDSKIQL